ncbi:hypothetical protein V6N13_074568 [Hibiscus sabdariffa]|uniref:Uncharacterized protein n=1 Tax=Hibiscus sabdariffa TaxID=183260 RepID=A0ABR2U8Y3_9ROSI
MTAADANQLISVQPNDLKFLFELDKPSFCDLHVMNNTDNHVAFKTIQHLKDERDAAVRQTVQLQQELDFLKRQRKRRNDSGFSFVFASFVAVIGIMVGYLLNRSFASPSTE